MRRLKTRAQFQSLLASPIVARTAHFAIHRQSLNPAKLVASVDGSARSEQPLFPSQDLWLGAMVPKRWARRAVTRNLFKRQIYLVSQLLEQRTPIAAHLVRLRAEFDRQQYASAVSASLRRALRAELLQLFEQAAVSPVKGARP